MPRMACLREPSRLQQDVSLTNAIMLILTLLESDIGLSLFKRRWPMMDRIMEGTPLMLIEGAVCWKTAFTGHGLITTIS